MSSEKTENVVIVGSGPAGHTAAIYTGRALLKPLMFEGLMAGGVAAGGQLTTTTEIENYPGFPQGISGMELMSKIREQSISCGALIKTETITKIDLSTSLIKIESDSETYLTRSLIIATGATAMRLHIKGEDRLWQKGMSACAVCDGGLPVFRNKPVIVIGGGDTACEEALYMTKFASKVYQVLRSDKMRASKIMQDRVFKEKKIEVLYNRLPEEVHGDKLLEKVTLVSTKNQEKEEIEVGGFFYAIGHVPNTSFLKGIVDLDAQGYIITNDKMETNIEGIYACGDVQDKEYRQAVVSAGSGCIAALNCEHYLETKHF